MLLAHRVLVSEVEVVEITHTLFSANIDFKAASLLDEELAPIFCYQFSICNGSMRSGFEIVGFGLFTTSICIRDMINETYNVMI